MQLLGPPLPLPVVTKLTKLALLQLVSGFVLPPGDWANNALVQVSFHVVSGMYPMAEA